MLRPPLLKGLLFLAFAGVILAIIIFFVYICGLFGINSEIEESRSAGWSCETFNTMHCSGKIVSVGSYNSKFPYINGSVSGTCVDMKKNVYTNFFTDHFITKDDRIIWIETCGKGYTYSSSGLVERFPMKYITAFKLCIKDKNIPAVTLHCGLLMNPQRIEATSNTTSTATNDTFTNATKNNDELSYDEYTSDGELLYDENVNCKEKTTRSMHFQNGEVINVTFNCLRIRLEKPIRTEINSTETTDAHDYVTI